MIDMMRDPMAQKRYETVDLLYTGIHEALGKVERAIKENNIEDIANNLGDALEGITILMDAVDLDAGGDAAAFLQGLYKSIFANLSTVLISRDVEAVRRAARYFSELKSLWRDRVLESTEPCIIDSPDVLFNYYEAMESRAHA